MVKEVLIESYRTTKKLTGIDPSKPGTTKQLAVDDGHWKTYVESLAESIENKYDRENFKNLAENTRYNFLEQSISAFSVNPYETLTLPILRVFYPKLVAKELVTVSPMDKPETVKAFIRYRFSPANSSTKYTAPVINTDISGGPTIGAPVAASITVPYSNYDVLATQTLDKTKAHLERDFMITAVNDGTNWSSVQIVPAVEGHFSAPVTTIAGNDIISGFVDYLNGTVSISSASGVVSEVRYEVTLSLEENQINGKFDMSVDKIRLYAKDRQISANWSINMDQDMRALFDVNMQAEIVNALGQQIALDIDREIITNLIVANSTLNAASHTKTFSRNPDASYVWGIKYWHENILTPLNELSAQVYNDTNIDAANVIAANPLDVAILEDINSFSYTGTSSADGELGYRSATVAGGKWKILTSAVVPQGTMLCVYKPVEEMKCTYLYSPYVPVVLHPYPLTSTPSLTILSRYATAVVRSPGVAVLSITG